MRICLVGSSRYPMRQPFAGGLESLTYALAAELAARGHEVSLFAGAGSDPQLPVRLLCAEQFDPTTAAMADPNAPERTWLAEHHAYLGLMLDLARTGTAEFDVVHNNSLHHLPVAMAPTLAVPMVTTLHTPPLPWLESALALAGSGCSFTAVSASTARAWAHVVDSRVITNGVDLTAWPMGTGGGPAVWSGRIVREKAPHEAIEASRRVGIPLVLAGPVHDEHYFRGEIEPLLGPGVQYAGHLRQHELARLLGAACVAVVTPAWEEPYGLVSSEAMACGTPVAAYARGAVADVVGASGGVVVEPGDVDALAAAVLSASLLDRLEVRRWAEQTCSLERMVDAYEHCYRELCTAVAA